MLGVPKCLSEEFLNHMNHLWFKCGGLIRGGVTDVDEPEPRPLRPQQVAISERSDRRRMGTGRTTDPAGQDWRRQAHGDHAGGGERSHVNSLDRLSVTCRREARSTTTSICGHMTARWDESTTRSMNSVANESRGKPVRPPPSSTAKA